MARILVIQGPNLNILGLREPNIYGNMTLDKLHQSLVDEADDLGHELDAFQSPAEYEIVEKIHEAMDEGIDFVIINAAAYTHTSIAIRDAFLAAQLPFIEVHISNIFAREKFRHHSYLSDIANGVIVGFGVEGYFLALKAAHTFLSRQEHS